MIRRPPRSTLSSSSAASDVYKRQAKNLTECKLQYSGTGYKISYAARQVCSGRVYLDCGITGSLNVQFRTTPSPNYYLQARLYSDAEWGWVGTGYGVSSYEANVAMCSKVTTTTGDPTINAMFLSVSWCLSNASSYTDCQYVYENGAPASTGFSCSSTYLPASSRGIDSSTTAGLDPAIAIGLGAAGGAIALIVFVVVIVVCCKMQSRRAAAGGANGTSGSGEEMSWHRTNNPSAPAAATTTYNYNNNGGAATGWQGQPMQIQPQPAQNNFYASSNAFSSNPPPPTADYNNNNGGLYGNAAPTGGLFSDQWGGGQPQQQQGLYQDGKSNIY
eukprot:TRINITY_DN10724_c0_g1_i1.p1 TRINITY_DN10724_c0_g1~~TRINITY_DN10724_c0_g1_i1.p1  ORF type:complete len:331 (+),score=77.65 TRINITY_DN10724_c0_g1_i1:141-1133(+)